METTRPTILLAHGAGAGSSSDWMRAWAGRLGGFADVHPFDYPYMKKPGRRAPDRLPKLLAAHREALEALPSNAGRPRVLAGKSMGSRVGCHLSLEDGVDVDGLVCFGFPLRSIGKNPKIRDEVLLALRTPILFIQGDRDRMGPLDLFAKVRARMTARSELHVVEGGDHSLILSKTHTRKTACRRPIRTPPSSTLWSDSSGPCRLSSTGRLGYNPTRTNADHPFWGKTRCADAC